MRQKSHPKKVSLQLKLLPPLVLILVLLCFYYVDQNKSDNTGITIDESSDSKVIIEFPNGSVMTTREKYIVTEGDKVYFNNNINKVDITDAEISFEE